MDPAILKLDDFLLKHSSYTSISNTQLYLFIFLVIVFVLGIAYILYKKRTKKKN